MCGHNLNDVDKNMRKYHNLLICFENHQLN